MTKRLPSILSLSIAMVLAALCLTAKPTASAHSLVGTWDGTFMSGYVRCSIQSIYQADGTYSELLHCGYIMTRQAGTYHVSGNVLIRSVEDWDPKQQWIVGSCVGCGYWETLAKPPGGSWRFTFTDANTVKFTDINLGGSVTMHRSGT